MNLAHPAINTRDTALFMSFRRTLNQKPNAIIPLQTLVKHFMGRDIGQNGDVPVRIIIGLWRLFCHSGLTMSRAGGTGSGRSRPLPLLRADLGGHHCHRGLAVCAAAR